MADPVLITARTLVRDVAQRWRAQYPRGCEADKEAIYGKLRALDVEKATTAEVEAIIGNGSWTRPDKCDGCGKAARRVVSVGEEPDYESSTAMLCIPCLKKALRVGESTRG